jgi:hypothetical protein
MQPLRLFPPTLHTEALASWTLLDLAGEVFLQSDSGFWFVDVIAAKLGCRWSSVDDLDTELNAREGQDEYLVIGLRPPR